jgi:hypothetical protein
MRKLSFPLLLKLTSLLCMIALITPSAILTQTSGSRQFTSFEGRAYAATDASYYVSPTGSDSNPGTISAPFQTITRARDAVRTINASMSGDIFVYLRGGTYNITSPIAFGPQDSGNNGYRVYYQAYPGETPVLSGAVKVTGWSQYSGNIYRATLNRSTKLRYLYVNDQRALMTSKTVTARGGYGTYSVTAGQAPWAWMSGSKSDGIQYNTGDVPAIASNRDDLEIVTASTWNENITTARDVITSGNFRVLLLQQPYGAIAQLPVSGAALVLSGSNTLYNAFEFLNGPGQFYFDKTNRWLYYYPRSGENMATADVQAPVAEQLITITGSSRTNRVKNLTFQGITLANTDYNLVPVGNSRGKATVQAATVYVAFGDGNPHNTKYQIMDTLPGAITVNNADSIQFLGNVVKHSGNEGISLINDVVNSSIVGNAIIDIAGSGITVGHPQHVYLDDGGTHEKYAPGVEGITTNNTISNNLIYNASAAPGFGGHAAITAFFVDTLRITNNQIQNTAYNGISLGWGWRNFKDSTTARNNTVNNNRLINTMSRLHDSGAIYTLGQMATTNINQNYVRGIPPASGGPRYGLHNDEGSAWIIENDSVLDIDPGVTYTINAEDFGEKHDLTIRRTYATVNKMGVTPPNSVIDPPTVVADAVWPAAQYNIALNSGIQDAYRSIIPSYVLAVQDYVFPASVAANSGTLLNIRSSGDPANAVWFAPAGTTSFAEGPTMTRAAGNATSIYAPATAGTYKLFVLNAQGVKLGESVARLRTSGSGTILREYWNNISGTAVTNLTSNPSYPNNPTGSGQLTSLEGPTNTADNYGSRIRGYIHPPASGAYTFWLASDDSGELWLSTSDNPANAARIAYVNSWTNSREWTKYTTQQSAAITLTAGQKYYIEVLQKEGTGGDNVAVAWQGPGIAQAVIAGSYLSPFTTSPSGEVLINGNTEAGTSGWGVFGAGTLASNTSVVHGGAQSLLLTGRTASWNGISQDVTSKLTNGRSYTTSVWVRTQSGTPGAKVTLALTANGSTSYISLTPVTTVNASGWTLLSGTATVSWSGTLSSALFYVETTAGTDSYYIDDASFQ